MKLAGEASWPENIAAPKQFAKYFHVLHEII